MKIEHENLLKLQSLDSNVDQLNHRSDHLPEREELVSVEADITKIQVLLDRIENDRAPFVREQKRIDDELSTIEEKSAKENKTLYSGSITGSKELQNLQKEIESLTRRQEDLETEVLEVMVSLEESEKQLSEVANRQAQLKGSQKSLSDTISEQESDVVSEIGELRTEREALLPSIDDEMVLRYEELRGRHGGVAVVTLVEGGICSGCRRPLPKAELSNFHRQDELHPCSHCKRLLVPGG